MTIQRIALGAFTASFIVSTLAATSAQDETPDTTTAAIEETEAPPAPGPDLLKYTPEQIEAAYEGKEMPEAVAMYLVVARGGQLDGTNGWFGPAQNRFSWQWLAERHGIAPDQSLAADSFQGPEAIFKQLDRDHDGSISGFDVDWSDENPWVRQSSMINRMFRRIDPSGDGKLTAEEWLAFFEKLAGEEKTVRPEQLRDALIPPSGFSSGSI